MLIVSLVVACSVITPTTILILRTGIAYGGIDLIIFAFIVAALLPNIVLIIPVVIYLKLWLKNGVVPRYSIIFSIALTLWSLVVIASLVQTRHMLHIWW